MTIYTYSEARQKLAALLEQAQSEGEVRIKRRDGQEFIVVPVSAKGSPLDVEGINLTWIGGDCIGGAGGSATALSGDPATSEARTTAISSGTLHTITPPAAA